MRRRPKLLWITDPWETLDHPTDTTLRLAQEACELGIQQSWCDVRSIRWEDEKIRLDAKPILSVQKERKLESFAWGPAEIKSPGEFSQIHFRTDPPIDLSYLHPLHLLFLGLEGTKKTEVVNPLDVLFCRSEKLEAAALNHLMPPSVVSSQWNILLQFGKSEGRTVLKPLHEAQSHGIELLDWRTAEGVENAKRKLQESTHRFTLPVILQRYLSGIAEGEIRIWFLDGKLLASIKKLPLTGDFRVDIDRGSQLVTVELSKTEKEKAQSISRHLRKRKIRLAAVDLIEGYLTDFNFTSPGLIVQMESVLGTTLARRIMQALT